MAAPPQGLRRENFQIAIICAVSCEYDAVALAFNEIWEGAEVQLGNAPGDYNKYKVGRIANRNAVLLLLSGMGKVNAASAAASLRSSYTEIKLAILSGICGGVPGVGTGKEVMLGDVVISRSIVQYDLGRRYADSFATKDTIEDSLGRPHESVRSLTAVFETSSGRESLQHRTNEILEDLQKKSGGNINLYQRPSAAEDRLFEPGYLHRHYGSRTCECSELGACEAARQASCEELRCELSRLVSRIRPRKRKYLDLVCNDTPAHELRVVVGRLGSGDTVMKSGLDRDRIAREQDLVAFEMEGAGVWDRFPCLVVKAVCDYADSHKSKKYQNFAAARAASATKAILEAFPYVEEQTQRLPMHVAISLVTGQAQPVDPKAQPSAHTQEQRENDTKLLHLLAADHEAHKNFNPERVLGTCEWFLRDQRYRTWLESTTSSIIWVSAGPGCGKSVLTRALIDDGRLSKSSTNIIVCHFFFKDGDERRMNSHDALASILHQLFTKDQTQSLIRHASSAFKNYGESLRSNFHQMWNILVDCASRAEPSEIVCVLDALDECTKQGRREIFQQLQNFYFGDQTHASSSRLKFLITSRPYDDLEISFEKMANAESYIRLDGDDKLKEIHHEINLVIDHKVNEFGKTFREEHRRAIAERLKAMKNRTYLWLHLTLNIIDERPSAYSKPSDIQELLSIVPTSVFDAYEKILSRSEDKEQAKCLLNIILASTHPLTLDEINYALTLQAKEFKTNTEVEEDMWPRAWFKTIVRNLCGLFISVYNDKVSLIHQTAREFLTTKAQAGSSNIWHGRFNMPSAHRKLYMSCIRALSLDDIKMMRDEKFRRRQEPHFMAYAAQNWTIHYNSMNHAARHELFEPARELCRTPRGQAPVWIRCIRTNHPEVFHYTDLTLASHFGLLEVVDHIIKNEYVDVNSTGSCFGTAIKAAAETGQLEVIKSLLQQGAVCDIGGGHFRTALLAAIWTGNLDVAGYLIRAGNEITEDVVVAAVRRDRQTTAYLIESHGDKVHITPAVIEAAASNSLSGVDVVAFLLDRRGSEFRITNNVVKRAAANSCGAKLIDLFLKRRGNEVLITEEIAEIAADNYVNGVEIIHLILETRGYEFEVTEEMFKIAAECHPRASELMDLLVRNLENESLVTSAVMASAACNMENPTAMEWLLDNFGEYVDITPETVINAVGNPVCGLKIIQLLLARRGDEIEITREVIMAAAEFGSEEIMEWILERSIDFDRLTEELVLAVAKNVFDGRNIMALLFHRYGEEVTVTSEVITSAAECWHGGDSLEVFFSHGKEIDITEGVLVAAARNTEGQGMMAFLLERLVDDSQITEKVLVAAARNVHEGTMAFLLERFQGESPITELVVSAAKKNWRRGEEIMNLLWDKLGGENELFQGSQI